MKVLKVPKGEYVAKRQNKVMEWYLIQEGSVVEKFGFAEIVLERNAMIGILESEFFFCDYIAREDTTLIRIPCRNSEDLQKILEEHENYRVLFLRTAIEQRHQALSLYQQLHEKSEALHQAAEKIYDNYKGICASLLIKEEPFARIEGLGALSMQHRVENWEVKNSESLMNGYFKEYLQLMMKDDAMCVGGIMEASAQVRRATLGIGEMVNYLLYSKDILLSESEDDLFHLFFHLAVSLAKNKRDIAPAQAEMKSIIEVMERIGVFTEKQLKTCRDACENYDYLSISEGRINVAKEDCVAHILSFANYEKIEIQQFKQMLDTYRGEGEKTPPTDAQINGARRWIMEQFYEVYYKVFVRVMQERKKPSPIIIMFLSFGFMDVGLLGEEYTNELYNLTEHLGLFSGEHVFTIFQWLKAIYIGKREPSKDELDSDFLGYLTEQRRMGEITEEELQAFKTDPEKKVEFEIRNMFRSAHRITSGQITTFFPILKGEDMLKSVAQMAVTAERIEAAVNRVREVDYSALYREVTFSDPEKGILTERIQKEVLPDVILLPVVGTRAAMWQEIEGVKRDSPARFLFPLFSVVDIEEQMIEQMGRYRWEMCRRMQGAYWNDLRDPSLTAEYYDYIQFYKKNSELTAEMKDKLKTALAKARNNYREVFVKDYVNWIKFESKGSFRLNKVGRRILVTYCPFCKAIRDTLKTNPAYETAFRKLEVSNMKKEKRLISLYEKYQAAGGVITPELEGNLKLCRM